MSKATNMPTTSRRGLLAGSGVGAIFAGIGVPAGAKPAALGSSPHPDAALIATANAFQETDRLYEAVNDPVNGISEDEGDRRHDIWLATLDVVTETPATTPEGLTKLRR